MYSLAPPLRQPESDNTDVQALQGWFDGHGGRVGYEVCDLHITIGDALALCTSLNRMGAPGRHSRRAVHAVVPLDHRASPRRAAVADRARAHLDPVLHGRIDAGSTRSHAALAGGLLGGPAAVDGDGLAGDEATGIADQP